jgi:nicotinate (nicotinamide) nucleotide adenylyltransferase
MKIGLLFGSFNPIHVGHLIIANYMANYTALDKVWLVVSPQNPLKKYGDLINAYDRLEMAKLATENATNITVSDVEMKLPQPSYTIDTLAFLKDSLWDQTTWLPCTSGRTTSLSCAITRYLFIHVPVTKTRNLHRTLQLPSP